MKKLIFLLLCFIGITGIGQQPITNKLCTSIRSGGVGVVYFTINYKAGKYTTQETGLITINATDTNNIWNGYSFTWRPDNMFILIIKNSINRINT